MVAACLSASAAASCEARAPLAPPTRQAPPPARAGLPIAFASGGRADSTLLPRKLLFGPAARSSPALSPDGKRIGFIAPENGVPNVFVGPSDDPSRAVALTHDTKRGIRTFAFSHDDRHVLYAQDVAGDENWHVHAVDLTTGKARDLTPYPGVQARVKARSPRRPGAIVVRMNDRDPEHHDLFTVDVATGKRALLAKNEQGFVDYFVDDDYRVRLASRVLPGGGLELQRRAGAAWKPLASIAAEDAMTTEVLGLDPRGKHAFLLDSRGRDKAALVEVDLENGQARTLGADERADVSGTLAHPITRKIEAYSVEYDRERWVALDRDVEADLAFLRRQAEGELRIEGRSRDEKRWLVTFEASSAPSKTFLYERPSNASGGERRATFLFVDRPALEATRLAERRAVAIRSRDGLELMSYLTLPAASDEDGDGRPAAPVPMVLLVHGGPWWRDRYGFDAQAQWLASRGYAVLQVNYRGSTGFGKAFVNAANLQWARNMQDDLLDAVDWAIRAGITTRDKAAIFGGSYGGFATLAALTMTPDAFACGVDVVGPSNLVTLLANVPPYWVPILPRLTTRIGDPRTDEGRALLLERSPLRYVDRIKKPLLIAQGGNDPRVKQAESDQIVAAMQRRNIPVTYVLYPDEGHGFVRPENALSFAAVAESFLARCLNGRYEPIGADFAGSSLRVPTGAEQVPGLLEAFGG